MSQWRLPDKCIEYDTFVKRFTMTEAELVDYIILKYKEKINIKDITATAAEKGFTKAQIMKAFEEAHIQLQQQADRDPAIRLILGPALLIIAGICFYIEWGGRSIGIASFIGAICIYFGIRMIISLIKQWSK